MSQFTTPVKVTRDNDGNPAEIIIGYDHDGFPVLGSPDDQAEPFDFSAARHAAYHHADARDRKIARRSSPPPAWDDLDFEAIPF